MKTRIVIAALSVPVLVALLSSCTPKRSAIGDASEVMVIADSLLYETISPALSAALEREILTPQPEKIFMLKYLRPSELGDAAVRHTILMAGTLDGEDLTSQQVRSMLTPELIEQVKQGQSFVFRKESPWAKNQLLLVLIATDAAALAENISANADYLYGVLREESFSRTEKELFAQLEQVDMEENLLEKYGWRVRVQHDYIIYKEPKDANFVMLRRTSPERWLFVYWIESGDPQTITRGWVNKIRNEIGLLYYEGDSVVDSLTQAHETRFAGRWALEVVGLWQNEEKVAGGPFKTFAFYDEITGRVYLVDISLFAPGMRKEPLLRQLEVMARTFRTVADLNMEKQKKGESKVSD